MIRIILLVLALSPVAVFADGGSDEPPTNPNLKCSGGQIYDTGTKDCVDPQSRAIDRDTLYKTARYLAYAERYKDAQHVLAAMPENDTGRLTYLGFTYRKLGQIELAMQYYEEALRIEPTNTLARSYMGQGLVVEGDLFGALTQLELIRLHGGTGTWSERSLLDAIETGETFNY